MSACIGAKLDVAQHGRGEGATTQSVAKCFFFKNDLVGSGSDCTQLMPQQRAASKLWAAVVHTCSRLTPRCPSWETQSAARNMAAEQVDNSQSLPPTPQAKKRGDIASREAAGRRKTGRVGIKQPLQQLPGHHLKPYEQDPPTYRAPEKCL